MAAQGASQREIRRDAIDEAAGAIGALVARERVNFSKGRMMSADEVAKLERRRRHRPVVAAAAITTKCRGRRGGSVDRRWPARYRITAAFTGRCKHFDKEAGLAVSIKSDRCAEVIDGRSQWRPCRLRTGSGPRQMVAMSRSSPMRTAHGGDAGIIGGGRRRQPALTRSRLQGRCAPRPGDRPGCPARRAKVLDKAWPTGTGLIRWAAPL